MPDHKYETPQILSDAPLRDRDQTHFHFDEFAVTLARLVASKKTLTPLTIGVHGDWGSGKTTLLQRIKMMLDQTGVLADATQPALLDFVNDHESPQGVFRPCRTVWFNAWKYADEDELLVALVRVIVQTMAKDDLVNKVIAKLLDPSYPRRDVVDTVLSWFSIKVGDVGIGLNTGTPVQTPFAEKTALLDLFDEAFNRLLAAWVHRKLNVDKINPEEGVLVVFIDDLDRCLPEKAVQVLEAVKLFLDKTGCIFVLGADTRIVRAAVAQFYKNQGVTGENADDYLEKIIQLRFDLPPIQEDVMGDYLNQISGADEILAEYGPVLVAGAEINPRKTKTFLNDLNLAWAMLVNTGQAEGVDRADFTRWLVLMRAAPENFRRRVSEIEDQDLRLKFVNDALRWAGGKEVDETLKATFQDYSASRRLQRVLRAIGAFGKNFDAPTLDAFLHLVAPPAAEPLVVVRPTAIKTGREPAPRRDVQTFGGLEFVPVPAGTFLMGSREEDALTYDNEHPQHAVEIPDKYWIGRFPVTNEQFLSFANTSARTTAAEETGFGQVWTGSKRESVKEADWRHPLGPERGIEERGDHPVVQVSWLDAQAYVSWLNETYGGELPEGCVFRLPTEAEWEKAARGEYANQWPWGNHFDPQKCNSSEGGPRDTTPVGAYSPAGDSPYGAADMVGNVWEWTHSLFKDYPYDVQDGRESEKASGARVLRGGSWHSDRNLARCASRYWLVPDHFDDLVGFRVVCAPNLF